MPTTINKPLALDQFDHVIGHLPIGTVEPNKKQSYVSRVV